MIIFRIELLALNFPLQYSGLFFLENEGTLLSASGHRSCFSGQVAHEDKLLNCNCLRQLKFGTSNATD